MASWHQNKNRAGLIELYTRPAKGYKVVCDKPGEFAYSVHFNRKREAEKLAKRCGGFVISARNI